MYSLQDLLSGTTKEERDKLTAWNNAFAVPGNPEHRYDCDNRLIRWSEYGRYSEFGWQIDHIQPSVFGGLDIPSNYRARHWRGNTLAGGLLGYLVGKAG
jgi:hypothetical protein